MTLTKLETYLSCHYEYHRFTRKFFQLSTTLVLHYDAHVGGHSEFDLHAMHNACEHKQQDPFPILVS
jgi:hypothetical protein